MPSHFHSPKKIFRVECRQIAIIDCVSEHRGPEGSGVAGRRLVAAPFQPGEQFDVGRAHAGPNQLDLLRVFVAERSSRGLRKPCRDADPQATGHELEQRPAAGLIELIEPARKLCRQLRFAEGGERGDDRRQQQLIMALQTVSTLPFQRSRASGGGSIPCVRRYTGLRASLPHQRDGLGEVTDIIVGQFEQHRVDTLADQRADHAGLGMLKAQRAGECPEREAALGVRGAAEIIRHQPQLVVATRLIGEAIEQFGEAVHDIAARLEFSVTSPVSSSSP